MHGPWSKLSKEEYARRKAMMKIALFGGGFVVIILFAIQVSVSLGASNNAVENDPLLAGQNFFRQAVQDTSQPLQEIDVLSAAAFEAVNKQAQKKEAQDAVIQQLKAGLASEAPKDDAPEETDVGTKEEEVALAPSGDEESQATHNDAPERDEETWTFEEDKIEETQ